MNNSLPIHERIRKEREKRCWSQRELSDVSGIQQPRIVWIEAGNPVTVNTLRRIAGAFGLELVITMKGKK